MYIKNVILAASILSCVACTHTPSLGEKMVAQGEQWNKGEKSVQSAIKQTKKGGNLADKGYKNINKGNKLVFKGNRQVEDGELLIEQAKVTTQQGQALQTNSESQFSGN